MIKNRRLACLAEDHEFIMCVQKRLYEKNNLINLINEVHAVIEAFEWVLPFERRYHRDIIGGIDLCTA